MFRIIPFFLHIALCVVMTPAVCRCINGAARLFRQLCSDENSCRLIGCFAYILISADAPILRYLQIKLRRTRIMQILVCSV